MKLATYVHQGAESFGVMTDDGLVDVPAAWADGPRSVLDALQRGPDALATIAARTAKIDSVIPLGDVKLLAPIPEPPKLLALAGNYAKHIAESQLAKGLTNRPADDTTPRPFLMPTTAVAAHGDVVPWPTYSRQVDYELELAIVIGAPCKCVTPAEAGDCIAGYTIANDVSARSVTFTEGRSVRPWDEFYDWLAGKWSDGFCPMGPCLVTADEVGDPSKLDLELRVNDEVRQKSNTSAMIFDVYDTVSFLSHLMTLTPGDIIATGTPHGVGMATGEFLQPGDVMACRIEAIGELTNTLGPQPEDFYTPCRK
jgi:2-keto-4-pentenoate hydratase/2-oxohepta-3-ene-1,7-dioic acid hydratase in catechol pathway